MDNQLNILLIEDDDADAEVVKQSLSDAQLNVSLSRTSLFSEGLSQLRKEHFDLILLDLNLSDVSRFEGLDKLVSEFSHTPIIVLTGEGFEEVAFEVVKKGAHDYINKSKLTADMMRRSVRYSLEKSQLQQKANRSHHLAALGTLSAGLAHEINNPLAIISGCLNIISSNVPFTASQKKWMTTVEKNVDRISRLVKSFLTFAREEKVQLEPLDIGSVILDIVEMYRMQWQDSGISLEYRQEGNLEPILGDRTQLESVIQNLLTNSRDAFIDKGRDDPDCISVSVAPEGSNQIQIIYKDTGCGMTQEVLQRIFDPLYTTKEGSKGTGLGMSILHSVLERHDGSIQASSDPRCGTTFTILLPTAKMISQGQPAQSQEGEDVHQREKKILLIGIDGSILQSFEDAFAERSGFRVDVAKRMAHGKDPILHTKYDFILTDIDVGGRSGRYIVSHSKNVQPQTPLAIMVEPSRPQEEIQNELQEAFQGGVIVFSKHLSEVKIIVDEIERMIERSIAS